MMIHLRKSVSIGCFFLLLRFENDEFLIIVLFDFSLEILEKPSARIVRRRNTTVEFRPMIYDSDENSNEKSEQEPQNTSAAATKRRRPARDFDVSVKNVFYLFL